MDHPDLPLARPLPPLRPGRPASAELIAKRGTPTKGALTLIAGVPCAAAGLRGAAATIVHLHGGGYRMGSAAGWQGFAERLAAATGAHVIVPDYALAPERPFPAAIHDAIAVLRAVAAEARGRTLILSGDSAGGGLALATASLFAAPSPLAGLVLLSPWLDLTLSAASFERCATTDVLFSHAAAFASAEDYRQGAEAHDPLASPLFADLGALPPVLVMAPAHEVLCDDALALAARLAQAGLRSTLIVEPGVSHIWPVLQPDLAASRRAIDQFASFVRDRIEMDAGAAA